MTLDGFHAQFKSYPEASRCRVKLLGIRGYRLDEGAPGVNDLGIYDDAIVTSIEDRIEIFRASTDPGRHYIEHPLNPQGCAKLQCGLWWYRPGEHLGVHPAFVQAESVTVDRIDRYGVRQGEESGWFGINIHSGGPEFQVGRWSAGCQIVQSPEGAWGATWLRMRGIVMEGLRSHGQRRFPYLLVEKLKVA